MTAARLLPWLIVLVQLVVDPGASAQTSVFYDGFEPVPLTVNEIEASDDIGGGADWVEFHNPTAAPVNLTGWYFTDNDPTHMEAFPSGTVVPAGGYLVIEPVFGLSSTSDAVALFTPRQQLADFFTWDAPTPAGSTHGRCPDGTGAFGVRSPPTRGTANCP